MGSGRVVWFILRNYLCAFDVEITAKKWLLVSVSCTVTSANFTLSNHARTASRADDKVTKSIQPKGTHTHTHTYITVIINYVSDYINLLVRIAHIICNHPLYTSSSHIFLPCFLMNL